MQSAVPGNLPHLGTSGVRFEKNIAAATDGRFVIKFYEPGALVPALECFDAAAKGSVESCWTTPGYHTGKLGPGISFFTTVPFGPQFGEFMAWKMFGGGDKLRDEIYAEHGLKAIDCFAIGAETSGWFKNEIKSLDQLKGLKMRFFGLGAQVAQKLGVSRRKIVSTVAEYANSSAATIPFTLSLAARGSLRPGAKILMCAAGAGLTGGAVVFGV